MDNELIDRSLSELQGLPYGQRSQQRLQAWLSFICEAGGIELGQPTSIQHEQLKLEASLSLLSQQSGATSHFASLRISSETKHTLYASLEFDNDPNHHAHGYGQTAVEVLSMLRANIARIGLVVTPP